MKNEEARVLRKRVPVATDVDHKAFAKLVSEECGYAASTCERVMDCYWKNVLDVLEQSKVVSVYGTVIQLVLAIFPTNKGVVVKTGKHEHLAVMKIRPKTKWLSYRVSVSMYRYSKWLWMKKNGHQFIKIKGDDSE